jgi:hypothetical protein
MRSYTAVMQINAQWNANLPKTIVSAGGRVDITTRPPRGCRKVIDGLNTSATGSIYKVILFK